MNHETKHGNFNRQKEHGSQMNRIRLSRIIYIAILYALPFSSAIAADPGEYMSLPLEEVVARADKEGAEWQHWAGVLYSVRVAEHEDTASQRADAEQAIKWFKKAAVQGYAMSELSIGDTYRGLRTFGHKDWIVAPNYDESIKWYRLAAKHGNIAATARIGNAYENGKGVPKSDAEAAKYYRWAAERGDPDGQYGFGGLCEEGAGVTQDFIEAYKWYSVCVAQGTGTAPLSAKDRRDSLAKRMTAAQIAEAQRRSSQFKPLGEDAKTNEAIEASREARASGTGFFITKDGYMLTAAHVVSDSSLIKLQTSSGLKPARIVRIDAANDVALLKVEGSFASLSVAASRPVKLGQGVFTVGFPNIQLQGQAPKLTKGEINSLSGVQDDPRAFQISAQVQPGNSGGPLVDEFGNVIGLVAARLSDKVAAEMTGALPQNVNYALKSSYILLMLESVSDLEGKLLKPNTTKPTAPDEIIKQTQTATYLILVY